jgi:hypothetical protein
MGGSLPVGGQPEAGGMETEESPLALSFHHVFGDADLAPGRVYETMVGEQVTVDVLRYWVSNVVLVDDQETEHAIPAAYFLVEQTEAKTRTLIPLQGIPAGTYTQLRFAIGVDADHNHSLDLFEGELSTELDMHWDWNSGFIFLKLEGSTGQTADKAPFFAHIGNDPVFQRLSFELDDLVVGEANATVNLRVDLKSAFDPLDVFSTREIVGGPMGSPADEIISRFAAGVSLATE